MIDFSGLCIDSVIYIALATILLPGLALYNPRLMLQNYPPAIKATPLLKTETEKRQSTPLRMPFLLALLILPFFFRFSPRRRKAGVIFLFTKTERLLTTWMKMSYSHLD